MNDREFGATGLKVSEVGFGCGRVGGLLIDGSDADRRLASRKALDGGINWFDTAEAYGDGKSEEALGWLLELAAAEPQISTKITVDPMAADLAGQIEEHGEACLKRLRCASVTVLQLHNRIEPTSARAVSVEQVLEPGGIVEGLVRMRARGRTRFIGFSGLGDCGSILALIESGRMQAVQVYYNLVNPSAGRRLSVALVGIGSPAHVDEALAAAAMGPPPAEALARLEPVYARDFR